MGRRRVFAHRTFSASPVFALSILLALLTFGCGARRRVAAITPRIGTVERGVASWYGPGYDGKATASGERYDMSLFTAAHQRYAFGTWVRIDNLDNGRSTRVRINDRGPFRKGRIIDLSRSAAEAIAMIGPGTARVKLVVIETPH